MIRHSQRFSAAQETYVWSAEEDLDFLMTELNACRVHHPANTNIATLPEKILVTSQQ